MSKEEEPPRLGDISNLSELEIAIFKYDGDILLYSRAKEIFSSRRYEEFENYKIRDEYILDFSRGCAQLQKCIARHVANYSLNSDSHWVVKNFGKIYKIFYILKYPNRIAKI